jgi:hypothetical protein
MPDSFDTFAQGAQLQTSLMDRAVARKAAEQEIQQQAISFPVKMEGMNLQNRSAIAGLTIQAQQIQRQNQQINDGVHLHEFAMNYAKDSNTEIPYDKLSPEAVKMAEGIKNQRDLDTGYTDTINLWNSRVAALAQKHPGQIASEAMMLWSRRDSSIPAPEHWEQLGRIEDDAKLIESTDKLNDAIILKRSESNNRLDEIQLKGELHNEGLKNGIHTGIGTIKDAMVRNQFLERSRAIANNKGLSVAEQASLFGALQADIKTYLDTGNLGTETTAPVEQNADQMTHDSNIKKLKADLLEADTAIRNGKGDSHVGYLAWAGGDATTWKMRRKEISDKIDAENAKVNAKKAAVAAPNAVPQGGVMFFDPKSKTLKK